MLCCVMLCDVICGAVSGGGLCLGTERVDPKSDAESALIEGGGR